MKPVNFQAMDIRPPSNHRYNKKHSGYKYPTVTVQQITGSIKQIENFVNGSDLAIDRQSDITSEIAEHMRLVKKNAST